MKKLIKFQLCVVLATMTVCSFTACSSDAEVDVEGNAKNQQFEKIAKQYLDYTVIPTYKALADDTEELVEKLKTLKEDKTDANIKAVCTTFLSARAEWEKSEAFLFGAATDFGIDPHIDSWPLDLDALLLALKNKDQISAMGGEDGDVYAGEKLGQSLLGFHGIEYIIFKEGKSKPVSEIADTDLIYAVAVAGDLRNKCFQLQLSWAGEDNTLANRVTKVADDLEWQYTVNGGSFSYSDNMMNAGKAGSTYISWTAAIEAIIDGCKTIADEVGTSKIGKPYSGENTAYIESPYSYTSITDFYDNIISVQNSYMGGVEGKRNESLSIHAYIVEVNPALDTKVMNAIATALTKIQSMKAPFVLNITDPSCKVAIDACGALDSVLSEVKKELTK